MYNPVATPINVGLSDKIRFVPDDPNYSEDAGDTYYFCFGEPTEDSQESIEKVVYYDENRWITKDKYKWYTVNDSFTLSDYAEYIKDNKVKINVFAHRDGLLSNGDKIILYDIFRT